VRVGRERDFGDQLTQIPPRERYPSSATPVKRGWRPRGRWYEVPLVTSGDPDRIGKYFQA
jgi:hypothetical protein